MTLTYRAFRWLLFVTAGLMSQSCLQESVDVQTAKAPTVNLQLHNFFAGADGRISKETVPNLFYFVQEADGLYTLTVSDSKLNFGDGYYFGEGYYVVHLDKNGVVTGLAGLNYPSDDFGIGDFTSMAAMTTQANIYLYQPRNYIANPPEFIYADTPNCGFCFPTNATLCILNPTTGQLTRSFKYPESFNNVNANGVKAFTWPAGVTKTSDGGYLTITYVGSDMLRFDKFTSNGTVEYSYFYLTRQARTSVVVVMSMFLKESNGDFYFINTNPVPGPDNVLKSFGDKPLCFAGNVASYEPGLDGAFVGGANFSVEIRFGQGRKQKAHRFLVPQGITEGAAVSDYTYQDYVDVPFQVWDITHNRQLMVSFRDQGRDGEFNLATENRDDAVAENQTREYLFIHDKPYSDSPDPDISMQGGHAVNQIYFINPILSFNAEWTPAALPNFETLIYAYDWNTQLMKLNANGFSEVKRDFLTADTQIQSIYEVVPYNNGYALLCNAPQFIGPFFFTEPAQLILMDNNLNQTGAFNISDNKNEVQHLMVSNGTTVFYASTINSADLFTNLPVSTTIKLASIKNDKLIERTLDEFLDVSKIRIENFNITPNQHGGVSLAAWVRPTNNTRDLLFMIFDENLELVKE